MRASIGLFSFGVDSVAQFVGRRKLRAGMDGRRAGAKRGAGRSGGPSQGDVHHHRHIQVYTGDPAAWSGIFRVLQGSEIWRRRGAWIDAHKPSFGPGIAEQFRWTRTIDPAEAERMRPQREGVARHLADLLDGDALLCLPTVPGIAPKLATPQEELEGFRARAFGLPSVAGLARLPQVTLPLAEMGGCPLGLSLIAPSGRDRGLLEWVAKARS